jgi:hypothetical protein
MKPPAQDIAARLLVWQALSDLYLDTALSPEVIQGNARILAESPYSARELSRILADEVNPVCLGNLFSVAGTWTAFDPAWLKSRILARHQASLKWPARFLPVPRSVRRQMADLLARVAALRSGSLAHTQPPASF